MAECCNVFCGGGALIYLAIKKKYEPVLLLPLGFGTILVNLPEGACSSGIIGWHFNTGIEASEAMPILVSRTLNSNYAGQICSAVIGGLLIAQG